MMQNLLVDLEIIDTHNLSVVEVFKNLFLNVKFLKQLRQK